MRMRVVAGDAARFLIVVEVDCWSRLYLVEVFVLQGQYTGKTGCLALGTQLPSAQRLPATTSRATLTICFNTM